MAEKHPDDADPRFVARARRVARKVREMMSGEGIGRSYYPEEPRKSRARILAELLWWGVRHREVNNYYFCCGLDRRSARLSDHLGYRSHFNRLRDGRNQRRPGSRYNYVCLLRDKFVFAQLVSSLGIPTPRAVAILDRDSVTWLDRGPLNLPLESLTDERSRDLDGFCKPLDGIQGTGAFPLKIAGGRIQTRDRPITLQGLRERLGSRYLLQERIEQHPRMSALHPHSVNTVRLITFCSDGKATLFSAAQRIGSGGKSVDNWAAGGLIVSIDPLRGELRGEGFFKPGYGGRTAVHPDTGLRFAGFQVPHFHEAVQLVTRLHEYLREIHSIGWDVGISTSGPTIIEGNDDWEGGIPMVLEKDFKQRYLGMHRPARPAQPTLPAPADVQSGGTPNITA